MIWLGVFAILMLINNIKAHCPLCTIGVAAAAGGATLLGVKVAVIGLFIGAFAVSTGWFVANMIKKAYIPFQRPLIIFSSFATTVIPLSPILGGSVIPYSLFLFGSYGSLFNTTYVLDLFIIGAVIGGIIVSIAPWLSAKITKLRNDKLIPFQGVMLTLLLLLVSGITIQFIAN